MADDERTTTDAQAGTTTDTAAATATRSGTTRTTPSVETDPAKTEERRRARRDRAMAKMRGNAVKTVDVLLDRVEALEDDLRQARERGGAKAGDLVLSGADVAEYQAFRALGRPATDLKAAIDRVPTLEAEVADYKAAEAWETVAALVGFNPRVLRRLARSEGFELVDVKDEPVDGGEDGETVGVPYVRPKSEPKATPVTLAAFAEKHLHDFAASLAATDSDGRQPPRLAGAYGAGNGHAPRSGNGAGATRTTRTTSTTTTDDTKAADTRPAQTFPRQRAGGERPAPDLERAAQEKRASGAYAL